MIYIYLIFTTILCSALLTKIILNYLNHKNIKAKPNHRSFHNIPTPIGGGWAIILTTLPTIITFNIYNNTLINFLPVLIGSLILIIISWQDDKKHTTPLTRLIFQTIAIVIAMQFLPTGNIIFDFLPVPIERIGIFFSWLWFINLYNFMDGIDGITSSETICICIGILIISLLITLPANILLLSSIILGAAIGFLIFNWQPAKIFIGDIGAIFLGYIIAYILLLIAIEGYVTIALLLPLYHLMDATIVILKRAFQKEKIWEPHQKQYFHRSVNNMNRSHANTTKIIILCNICLIALAIASIFLKTPYLLLIIGIMITYKCMHHLAYKVDK